MPMEYTWKKIMSGALVIALATGAGATAFTAPTAVRAEASTLKTPFTDVASGHWAEKHILKLYLQGIIDGYKNTADNTATFKPEKSVSQQEAVLMALRFAGLAKQVDTSSMIVFDESFVVNVFFKPYIELAFTEGLLDREMEYKLASNDKANTWGEKPASREWVTKLIVNAIGQQAVANQLQNAESHFRDAAKIDNNYKGFVNAAFQLGLVKGMTEYTFEPDKPVTRASLATLFSRAQSSYPVAYEGQVAGIVAKLSDNSITLYSNDKETSYTLDESTLYYHYNSEKPITKDQLLKYGDVSIIAKDGKALYIEVEGETQHTEMVAGTFARYNSDESVIYLWINNKPVPINYTTELTVEDSEGKPLSILDLKVNSQVTVVQDTFRAKRVALKIIASSTPVETLVSGDLVSADQKVVTIKTKEGLVSKFAAPGAVVEISGLSNPSFDDLIKNEDQVDQVELSLNGNDQVTKVKVTNREVKVLAGGRISQYDEVDKYITVVDSNKEPMALKLTDKTKFDYMGTPLDLAGAMSISKTNVNVVIRYTHKNVVSLKFVISYTGTVTEIDTKNKWITLMAEEGVIVKMPYANTVIDFINRPLANHLDVKTGDVVTLNLNASKVEASAIRMHQMNQYEIVSTDAANKKIKVKTASNSTYDVSLLNAEVWKVYGIKGAISDLKAGNQIQVSYVGSSAVKVQVVSQATNG